MQASIWICGPTSSCTGLALLKLGTEMEQKLSDFSEEKRKWNEKMEAEFFWPKRTRKRTNVFDGTDA
jgi:hypothetical protein